MKQTLESQHVVKTKGPYVQGVALANGRMILTSGVVARDVHGKLVGVSDIRAQTRQCLENIRHVIEAGGGTLRDLAKVTVYLRDLKDYDGMNEVRREILKDTAFASTTVQAALNAPEALIEIEAIAFVGST